MVVLLRPVQFSPDRMKWGTLPCREMYSVPCIVGCPFVFVFKDGVDDCMKIEMVKVREGSLRKCVVCIFMETKNGTYC